MSDGEAPAVGTRLRGSAIGALYEVVEGDAQKGYVSAQIVNEKLGSLTTGTPYAIRIASIGRTYSIEKRPK